MIVKLAVDHLLRGTHDRVYAPCIQQPELAVGFGGRALDEAERADDRQRHALVADAEGAARAPRFRAPHPGGPNPHRPEGVGFGARACHGSSRRMTTDDAGGQRRIASDFCRSSAVVYFLRNRSSRTTSPPPAGVCGASSDGASAGFAACGAAAITGV